MRGECSLCFSNNELEHLNLYVKGSEGIWVCLPCKIALTQTAEAMLGVAARAKKAGFKLGRKEAVND